MSKKLINTVKNMWLSEEDACKHWQVDRDICRSTCSPSILNEHSPHTQQNRNNRRSPVLILATHSPHWHQCVFSTREADGHKSQSGSLSFFTGLSFSCSCVCFIHRIVFRFLSYGVIWLLCEAKKWEQNRLRTTMKKCYSFQKPSKRSYKCLFEQRGLKRQIFRKFRKTTFPDLFPVNRCVNGVTRVCRGWIEAALPATSTTRSSKTRRRMDFGLVAFF